MKTTPYTYYGPDSGMSLPVAKVGDEPQDILLRNGQQVNLPADSPVVATLLAQGYLKPLVPAPEPVVVDADDTPPPAAAVKPIKGK